MIGSICLIIYLELTNIYVLIVSVSNLLELTKIRVQLRLL